MDGDVRERVRERYAAAARGLRGEGGSCCGSEPRGDECDMTGGSYSGEDAGALPAGAAGASLGCGNPVALATLSPGEVVLDLGSGGGLDVLLSARRVAPSGRAYGLDMTDEMLALARRNRQESGLENVEFLKGEMEAIPLPGDHVDVVISNCVVNLSPDKPGVLREAYRILKPGGRFAVSDVVFLGEKGSLPEEVLRKVELWTGCIAGALEKTEYEAALEAAGFEDVSVEVTHTYPPEIIAGLASVEDAGALRAVPVASAFVRGSKPLRAGSR
jgi:SAM-dependent methyltransferase